MVARSYIRGHSIYYDAKNKTWKYTDDDSIADDSRPCIRCGKYPTKEGYDACVGFVDGAISVCCGHGVERGYIKKNEES